jgi:hypothetical protein
MAASNARDHERRHRQSPVASAIPNIFGGYTPGPPLQGRGRWREEERLVGGKESRAICSLYGRSTDDYLCCAVS